MNFIKILIISSLTLSAVSCFNKNDFPVTQWNRGNNDKPVIFYISGDAGFSKFTKSFAADLHAFGYDVFALDSRKYFWTKRTPESASQDVENYLKNLTANRTNKKIILIGFSYGADVSPFIYNRFDKDFQKNISQIIIIGPSKINDFEIHISQYITGTTLHGFSVLHEINRLNLPTTVILSNFEYKYFPWQGITLKNYKFLHIDGDHHYNGNTKMLANTVEKQLIP